MLLHLDPHIAYECVQCGKGCSSRWDILVEPSVIENLKQLPMTLRVIQERGQAFVHKDGANFIHKDQTNSRCGFLLEDMLCEIHRDLAYEAKPLTCQQYPYLMTQTPDGQIYVSAAYSCTAVKEEIGPPLEESRKTVEDLIARGGRVHRLQGDLEVLPGISWPWQRYLEFEESLLQRRSLGWEAILEDGIAGLSQDPRQAVGVWDREIPSPVRSQLRFLRMVLSMGLLKPCLPSQDRQQWHQIDASLMGEQDLVLPDFNWNAPLSDLELWINTGVGEQFNQQIERYQDSLFFRKSHLTMGGLLPGLWLLWLKPPILRLLTGLWAWKHQREPGREDFLWALDQAETHLVAHTFDTVPIYRQAAIQSHTLAS